MGKIHVVVTAQTQDLRVQGIVQAVCARQDMRLAGGSACPESQVAARLAAVPAGCACAVIRIGQGPAQVTTAWLERFAGLVILEVDLTPRGPAVRLERFASRHTQLDDILAALKGLIEGQGHSAEEPASDFAAPAQTRPVTALPRHAAPPWPAADDHEPDGDFASPLALGLDWLHQRLLCAVVQARTGDRPAGESEAWLGLGPQAAAVEQSLRGHPAEREAALPADLLRRRQGLAQALATCDEEDDCRLAQLFHRLGLTALELEFCLLLAAPDLEPRFQHSLALLQDDASRRVGCSALYAALLGDPVAVRQALLASGGLLRWRLIDATPAAGLPGGDDPVRADPQVLQWLLGAPLHPELDPLLQRFLALPPWPGTRLLRPEDRFPAHALLQRLGPPTAGQPGHCLLVTGTSPAHSRALLEWGARLRASEPLRVPLAALTGLTPADLVEAAIRLARASRLAGRVIVVDAAVPGGSASYPSTGEGLAMPSPEGQTQTAQSFTHLPALQALGLLLGRLSALQVPVALVCHRLDEVLPALADLPFDLHPIETGPTQRRAWVERGLLLSLDRPATATADDHAADLQAQASLAESFPLQIDGFELAMQAARAQAPAGGDRGFVSQCRRVAAAGVSRLAEHIEPRGRLADVVLPSDRQDQLREILASVRLSSAVLEGWQFGRDLPYGRGTTALFHGPSGTGKTMAAHAIAAELQVHLLRIDLSRVVSKYIGETEKHCDQVFADASRSGAAILIDEADALFGKRGEVKDAHDRYANIEVAFLLQRIEQFDGLAILTSNLRQNIDSAFLRRLRFIIDFPRPDLAARLNIWRACLPAGSHRLGEAELRELAGRVDLTGGHIRQITLRAAFMAADRGELIELRHLKAAARAELAKLGLPATGLDPAAAAPARPARQAA